MALVIMVCATKGDQDWIKFWISIAFWMQTGLEIWIKEDIQVGVYLTYLEVQSIG